MKVLVVRLSAIGDVVHTLPVLVALHDAGHEVFWLVEPAARTLLADHPYLARVVVAPAARRFDVSAAWRTLKELRRERFDAALDVQGLYKSAVWSRLSGAARVIGHEGCARREPLSARLLDERVAVPAHAVHVVDKNLALLKALGIDAIGLRRFPLPPAAGATEAVRAQLEAIPSEFALLNPGGGWDSKLWPPESFGKLARQLGAQGLPSLVSWGPGEQALAERVVVLSEGAARVAIPTTLLQFAELARRARVVVAADTGPLHIACAVGAAVVGLYGPTDPARNGPVSAADRVVRSTPPCAPCHRRRCPVHQDVMNSIDVNEGAQAVWRRLPPTEARA